MLEWRVGIGVDHHILCEQATNAQGKPLTLGGYVIPNQEVSLTGNCDGDVMVHALCNALSTAIGGGSLAPITDPICASGNLDSITYLEPFLQMVSEAGYVINNVSYSVEAARPHLEKHREGITTSLAAAQGIEKNQIGMAFTTGEGLTACGRGEGIYAQVVVSLKRL
jgi:2-C-methyl-D-erythritol 2,4-cyclodiphosphate synthase